MIWEKRSWSFFKIIGWPVGPVEPVASAKIGKWLILFFNRLTGNGRNRQALNIISVQAGFPWGLRGCWTTAIFPILWWPGTRRQLERIIISRFWIEPAVERILFRSYKGFYIKLIDFAMQHLVADIQNFSCSATVPVGLFENIWDHFSIDSVTGFSFYFFKVTGGMIYRCFLIDA